MFQNAQQPSFSMYHPHCLTSSRNTLAEPSSCPPILFAFLPGFLWKGVHRLGSKCQLFLPQILTPIPGRGTKVRMNMDREDGFLQWRWQSEPSGEQPPSTGKEPFPFSKEKATMCSEVSELLGYTDWLGGVISHLHYPQKTPTSILWEVSALGPLLLLSELEEEQRSLQQGLQGVSSVPQVANTRPTGRIQPSTLFYPAPCFYPAAAPSSLPLVKE